MSTESGAFWASAEGAFIRSPQGDARGPPTTAALQVRASPRVHPEGTFNDRNAAVMLVIDDPAAGFTWVDPIPDAVKVQIFDALAGQFPGEAGTYDAEIGSVYSDAQKAAALTRIDDLQLLLRWNQLTPALELAAAFETSETLTWSALPGAALDPAVAVVPIPDLRIEPLVYMTFAMRDRNSTEPPFPFIGDPADAGFTGECGTTRPGTGAPECLALSDSFFTWLYRKTFLTDLIASSAGPRQSGRLLARGTWRWTSGYTLAPELSQVRCCGNLGTPSVVQFPDQSVWSAGRHFFRLDADHVKYALPADPFVSGAPTWGGSESKLTISAPEDIVGIG